MNANPLLDPFLLEIVKEHVGELVESGSLASRPTAGTSGVWQLLLTLLRRPTRPKASGTDHRPRRIQARSPCHVRVGTLF